MTACAVWSFSAQNKRESDAVQGALEALLNATLVGVPRDALLEVSPECRYRQRAVQELQRALLETRRPSSTAKSSTAVLSDADCAAHAEHIERALFERFFVDDIGRYAERLRVLVANLRANGYKILLRYGADAICSMPAQKLAVGQPIDAWRRKRSAALLKDLRRRHSTAPSSSAVSATETATSVLSATLAADGADNGGGIFRCPKCKGHNTSYISRQTRSADEPMTNFVTCHTCEKRFRR